MEVNPVLCMLCSLFIGISLGFECKEGDSSYYHHEKDCGKFYECKNGSKFLSQCPVGTHWSKTTNSCELPSFAQCKDQPKTIENTENKNKIIQEPMSVCLNGDIIAMENDKTRFIKCVAGAENIIGCPKSFVFNNKIKTCDFQQNLSCSDKIAIFSTCTEDEDYSLHADPTSCKKYIQCVDGKAVSKHCPGSHYFETDRQVCTSGELVDCQVIKTDESSCPSEDDLFTATNMSYPNDCAKYYIIINGEAYPVKCPIGKHWSSQSNHCELPEIAKCDSSYSSVQPNKLPGEPIPHEDCPENENPDNPTHLPYPDDCTKFYKCLNGYAYPIDCPPGLHWSIELDRCEWPEVANCEQSSYAVPPKLSAPNVHRKLSRPILNYPNTVKNIINSENKCAGMYDGYMPVPNDCTKYVKCMSGIDVTLACPTGLHWNAAEDMCDYPENAMCDKSKILPIDSDGIENEFCPLTDNPKYPKYLPYADDCSLYYVCRKGKAYIKICPPEAQWNEQENKCDYPEVARCKNRNRFPVNSLIEPKQSPLCTAHRGQKKNLVINFKHENDCAMFYTCRKGFAYPKNCPPGLLWNETWKRCYYAEVTLCKTGNNLQRRFASTRGTRSLLTHKYNAYPDYNTDDAYHLPVEESIYREQHLLEPYQRQFHTRPKAHWPNMEENANNRPFGYYQKNAMFAANIPQLPPGPSSMHRLSSFHRPLFVNELSNSPNLPPIPSIAIGPELSHGQNFDNRVPFEIPDDRDMHLHRKGANRGTSSFNRPSFLQALPGTPNLPPGPAVPSMPKLPNGPNFDNRIPIKKPEYPNADFQNNDWNTGGDTDVAVPGRPTLPPGPSSGVKPPGFFQPSVPDIPVKYPDSPGTDSKTNGDKNTNKNIKDKEDINENPSEDSHSDEKPTNPEELPDQPSFPDVPVRKPTIPDTDPSSNDNDTTDKDMKDEEDIVSAVKKAGDDTDNTNNSDNEADCINTTTKPTPNPTTKPTPPPDPEPTEEGPEKMVFNNPFEE